MQKYRRKSQMIEAIPFDGTPKSACEVFECFDIPGGTFIPKQEGLDTGRIRLPALAGNPTVPGDYFVHGIKMVFALPGGYIIRNESGEYYPCSRDVFEADYEAAK